MVEEVQRQFLAWNRNAVAEKLAASGVERFDVPLLVIYLGEMDVCGLLAEVLRDHGASAVGRCFAEVLAGDPSRHGPEQVLLSEVDAERPVARLSVALVYLMALKCPSEIWPPLADAFIANMVAGRLLLGPEVIADTLLRCEPVDRLRQRAIALAGSEETEELASDLLYGLKVNRREAKALFEAAAREAPEGVQRDRYRDLARRSSASRTIMDLFRRSG
jgi:hypothetical protein